MKPRLGLFSFTSCEGCQLQVLNLEAELLDILNAVDIVNFREAIDEKSQDYDIAFVEGSITTSADLKEVKEIRQNAKKLVALGACACIGGVNALKNSFSMDFCKDHVYKDKAYAFDTFPTKKVSDIVKVDFEIPGCPISKKEFVEVTKKLLFAIPIKIPNYSVCTECKMNGNLCLYEKNEVCIGPITRGGCDAICPTFKDPCHGCRGFMDNANFSGMIKVLEDNNISEKQIKNLFSHYNGTKTLEEYLA